LGGIGGVNNMDYMAFFAFEDQVYLLESERFSHSKLVLESRCNKKTLVQFVDGL